MKWLWYEVTLAWSDWYEETLIWSDFVMRWLWYEVHWYEVTLVWSDWYEVVLVWSALVWSDFDMKCRMVCSALVWSAWYEVTIFPFGMKWRKKWSAGWMKWLGTIQVKFYRSISKKVRNARLLKIFKLDQPSERASHILSGRWFWPGLGRRYLIEKIFRKYFFILAEKI